MNLVSAVVGLSIMGIAAPTVLEMSVTPIIAQKRASNFGRAESSAVVFAAAHEGKADADIPDPNPDVCTLDRSQKPAYKITCTHGRGKYEQTVKRSFKGEPNGNDTGGNAWQGRFPYPAPPGFTSTECFARDNWGINTNAFDRETYTWKTKSCMPSIIRGNVGGRYHASDINSWLYDINNWNGWGDHQDY